MWIWKSPSVVSLLKKHKSLFFCITLGRLIKPIQKTFKIFFFQFSQRWILNNFTPRLGSSGKLLKSQKLYSTFNKPELTWVMLKFLAIDLKTDWTSITCLHGLPWGSLFFFEKNLAAQLGIAKLNCLKRTALHMAEKHTELVNSVNSNYRAR